jgi:superoxide reductase
MNRRALLCHALGAAAVLVPPRYATAAAVYIGGPLAGSVYYTRENPGRWKREAQGHAPRIEIGAGPGGIVSVTVTTEHEMDGHRHYIVKHMLLDREFRLVGEKRFDPARGDRPVSRYALLAGYRGPVYAVSLCNRHDLWIEGTTV